MMYTRDLDEQYTPDTVFLFCIAVFFILMPLLQMHYIFSTLGGVLDQNVLNSFLLPYNSFWKCLQTVMQANASNYIYQDVCKVKPIHLASYVEVEKLTSKVNAALW